MVSYVNTTKGTVQIVPLRRKDGKYSKSLSGINQEFFTHFKYEKEDCTKWKLGQIPKVNCKHMNQRCYSRESEGYLRVTMEGLKCHAFCVRFQCKGQLQ